VSRLTNIHKPIISPRIRSADPSKSSRSLAFLNRFDKDYEILFKIENENQIKVPKGKLFQKILNFIQKIKKNFFFFLKRYKW